MTSNKTREFTLHRLQELSEEFNHLQRELNVKLQRIKEINIELNDLVKTLQVFLTQPETEDSTMVNGVQISPLSTGPIIINGVKIRRDSIKDYVVQVLSDSERGMVALDILAEINKRFNKQYQRPSLSPQLSRLKDDGVLGLRGPFWYLKPKHDIVD